jgi:DNA-binding MarR family transcriptional regulator
VSSDPGPIRPPRPPRRRLSAPVAATRASHLLARRLIAELPDLHLSAIDALAIERISRANETPTSLSDALGLAPSTVTSLVHRLVRREIVRRMPSGIDRRYTVLRLTPDGTYMAERVRHAVREVESALLERVDEADLDGLVAVAESADRLAPPHERDEPVAD